MLWPTLRKNVRKLKLRPPSKLNKKRLIVLECKLRIKLDACKKIKSAANKMRRLAEFSMKKI